MKEKERRLLFILIVFVSLIGLIGTAWSQVSLPTATLEGSIPTPPAAIGSQLTLNITTGTVNYYDGVSFADFHWQDSFIGSSMNITSGGLRTGPAAFSAAAIEVRDLDGTHVYMTADLVDPLTGDITFSGAFPVYFLNVLLDANDPTTLNLSNVVLFPDAVGHPSRFMDELQTQLGSGTDLGLSLNCTGDLSGAVPGFDCVLNNGVLDGVPVTSNQPPVAVAGVTFNQEQCLATQCEVTLDGSESTDADSTPGTNDDIVNFAWFEDVDNDGVGPEDLIATGEVVTVNLSLGFHDITLRVTDSQGEIDDTTITVAVDPAELSFIEITKAEVFWNYNWIQIKGRLALPAGVSHEAVNSVGSASISLSGGLGEVVYGAVDFEERRNGKKWRYHDCTHTQPINWFKIDWDGAKFDYLQDGLRIKSHHFGDDSTAMEVEFDSQFAGPADIVMGSVTVSIAEDHGITVTGATEYNVDVNAGRTEVEVLLPFDLGTIASINVGGTPVNVADFYTAAVGKFKIKAPFDSLGTDPDTIDPKELVLDVRLGDQGFSGIMMIENDTWTKITNNKWKYRAH